MSKQNTLYTVLTYAGAIPFLVCAIAVHMGISHYNLIPVSTIINSYGLAIVSFVAGTHWATQFFNYTIPKNLFISSNIITIAAWFTFWLAEPIWSILVLVLCFISLLVIDRSLKNTRVIPSHYYRLRRNITFIVLLSLIGFGIGIP